MKEYVKEISNILDEFDIKNGHDYLNKTPVELSEIYENIKIVQEKYHLTEQKVEKILERILGKFEEY